MKIKDAFRRTFFLKLFFIPSLIWILLSLFLEILKNKSYNSLSLTSLLFYDFIILILWFIISLIIFLIYESVKKNKDKNEEQEKKISTLKKIRFPFIMGFITFLIGTFLSFNSVGAPIKVKFTILFISYLPVVLFLIIVFLIYKFKDNRKIVFNFKVITFFVSLVLIVYYFYSFTFISLKATINPVTNPKYYEYYVTDERLKYVFPDEIPNDVENVKFFYSPIFLQGGTKYSLYYVDKDMTLEKFNQEYQDKAIWIGYKKDYTENKSLLPYFFIHTPSYYKNEDDYLIYLVEGNCKGASYCSHGDILLAAFNEKTKEVIFRSQQW